MIYTSLLKKIHFYYFAMLLKTRPDTRHKMRLVCVFLTFKNNTGHTDGPTDLRTDLRTDTTSYRDATAHLKIEKYCLGNYDIVTFNILG